LCSKIGCEVLLLGVTLEGPKWYHWILWVWFSIRYFNVPNAVSCNLHHFWDIRTSPSQVKTGPFNIKDCPSLYHEEGTALPSHLETPYPKDLTGVLVLACTLRWKREPKVHCWHDWYTVSGNDCCVQTNGREYRKRHSQTGWTLT